MSRVFVVGLLKKTEIWKWECWQGVLSQLNSVICIERRENTAKKTHVSQLQHDLCIPRCLGMHPCKRACFSEPAVFSGASCWRSIQKNGRDQTGACVIQPIRIRARMCVIYFSSALYIYRQFVCRHP